MASPKNKSARGRPTKFKDEYCEQARKLCLLGAIDKDIADFFEVDEATINRWKKSHPEFCESLKSGKKIADADIAERLHTRAKGMYILKQQAVKMRKTEVIDGKEITSDVIEVVDLMHEQPPDTTAGIFWLKNRQPELWRDKPEPIDDSEVQPVKVVIEVEDARDYDRNNKT